jgi:hypothetical protein
MVIGSNPQDADSLIISKQSLTIYALSNDVCPCVFPLEGAAHSLTSATPFDISTLALRLPYGPVQKWVLETRSNLVHWRLGFTLVAR